MSDREILRKYINLDNTCLTENEKEEVMNMLYKYEEAFCLRDEIGTCPNIEVGIEVTDKSPFFIRWYHVREEDKEVIDLKLSPIKYDKECNFLRNLDDEDDDQIKQNIKDLLFYCSKVRPFMALYRM